MKRKKILMLENLPFDANIKIGSHHYAEHFSKDYQVLWISLPFHIMQYIKDRKSDRIRNWHFNRAKQINKNLFSITPFTFLPYRNNSFLKSDWYLENYYKFMPFLLSNIKKLGFDDVDIIWFTDPRHIGLLNKIKSKKIFYRCVDNLEHFDDIPKNLLNYEKELIKKSNSVFFTSHDLMMKFDTLNENVYYLGNGCDYENFNNYHSVKVDEVKKYFDLNKINLLYIGAIAEWFDFKSIEILAKERDVNIVIVGPIRTNIPDVFKKVSNVKFVGPYSYGYMSAFTNLADIGVIPFMINTMTDSVNPIKLYEYCASGLPVISSAFKTVQEIDGPFKLYKDENGLIEAFNWAKNIDDGAQKEIRKFALRNSWEARANYVKIFFKE